VTGTEENTAEGILTVAHMPGNLENTTVWRKEADY